ncbi:hypothetical protein C5E10_15155 [Pseudoclavibacter sp. RFBG4]|nr:hypothetical protein C5E10_15155 [Pseudoclavibacter sp. RFBG4]
MPSILAIAAAREGRRGSAVTRCSDHRVAAEQREAERGDAEHDQGADQAETHPHDEPVALLQAQLQEAGQADEREHEDAHPDQVPRGIREDRNAEHSDHCSQPDDADAHSFAGHCPIVHAGAVPRVRRLASESDQTSRRPHLADVLLFSAGGVEHALPSLTLLAHRVRVLPPTASALASAPQADANIIDGTSDLPSAKRLCGVLNTIESSVPVLLAITEGGLPAISSDWGIGDVILRTAGPAEVDARIRLLRPQAAVEEPSGTIAIGPLTIDEHSYTARYRGRTLDLTFKEFELLRYLASHPDHVFTRERLLSEVWGYDYFGGTRTVDVHVRRLRAKLGDQESVIGTVRNVGYRLLRNGEAARDEPVPTGGSSLDEATTP